MKTCSTCVFLLMLAAPGAWAQTQVPAPQQALITVENHWSRAAVSRNRSDLSPFYGDEYIFTDEDGVMSNKDKEIDNIVSGVFRLRSFTFRDLKVQLYGDVAVVTGKNTIAGAWEDIGKDISGPYRFTDVFVRRSGRWQCIASQSSRIAVVKEAEAAGERTKMKGRMSSMMNKDAPPAAPKADEDHSAHHPAPGK